MVFDRRKRGTWSGSCARLGGSPRPTHAGLAKAVGFYTPSLFIMKILWICGLPREVQDIAFKGESLGAQAAWSWVMGHLPPPPGVELHIACPVTRGPWKNRSISYRGAMFHLIRCLPGRCRTGFLLDPFMYKPLHMHLAPDLVHGWGTEDSHSIATLFLEPKWHVVQVQGVISEYRKHMQPLKLLAYIAWRERRTLRNAHSIFVESNYSGSVARKYCSPDTRIEVVQHPLRPHFLEASIGIRRDPEVLFVGSLSRGKGYLDAVRAFAKSVPSHYCLTIIGGASPACHRLLTEQVHASGIANRCKHIAQAPVDTIIRHMQSSSIFLLPSYMDTGPTALKEALAMGLWPVCYDNSGPRELITRYGYGSLARTGDTGHLGDMLEQAIKQKPWLEPGRMEAVSRRVRHDLSAATIWPRLIELYKEITEED